MPHNNEDAPIKDESFIGEENASSQEQISTEAQNILERVKEKPSLESVLLQPSETGTTFCQIREVTPTLFHIFLDMGAEEVFTELYNEDNSSYRDFTLTQKAIDAISEFSDETYTFSGGWYKQTYMISTGENTRSVLLLFKPFSEEGLDIEERQRSIDQVLFYANYHDDQEFQDLVVPLEAYVTDKNKDIIGMMQKFYGVSLSQYIEIYGEISKDMIDDLLERYQKFIELSKTIHGDLLWGYDENGEPVINDNMRVSLKTGKIKFIDYNGTGEFKMTVGRNEENEIVGDLIPRDPHDLEVEVDNLRKAMYKVFNITKEE